MKIVTLLVAVAIVYVLYAKQSAVSPELNDALKPQTGESPSAALPATHSFYKRALDRADSVAGQVRSQQKQDSF